MAQDMVFDQFEVFPSFNGEGKNPYFRWEHPMGGISIILPIRMQQGTS
jgi:hypothetical protein